jgi:hypothetical protein
MVMPVTAWAPLNSTRMLRVMLLPICRGGMLRRFCCSGTQATANRTPSEVSRPSQFQSKSPTSLLSIELHTTWLGLTKLRLV